MDITLTQQQETPSEKMLKDGELQYFMASFFLLSAVHGLRAHYMAQSLPHRNTSAPGAAAVSDTLKHCHHSQAKLNELNQPMVLSKLQNAMESLPYAQFRK